MKRWVAACGVLCACSAACPDDKDIERTLTAGTYVPAALPSECDGSAVTPVELAGGTDQLEISEDLATVTETYTRDGKAYRVVYDVTGTKKF